MTLRNISTFALCFALPLVGCGGDKDDDHTGHMHTDEMDTDTDTDADADTDADTNTDTDTDTDTDFDLSFSGSGYNPHEGQLVEFALVDDADATTTVWQSTVSAGAISESWAGALADGHSYTLYWYADLSGDSACTAPPADHGWSESISTVSGAVDITRDHDAIFEYDVCSHF